ncbi:MAG TPA: hypothetical protein VMO47_19075 [Rhodothermales bacterium]|nr:hypothetical protein [Rhodothermales bacterium]
MSVQLFHEPPGRAKNAKAARGKTRGQAHNELFNRPTTDSNTEVVRLWSIYGKGPQPDFDRWEKWINPDLTASVLLEIVGSGLPVTAPFLHRIVRGRVQQFLLIDPDEMEISA